MITISTVILRSVLQQFGMSVITHQFSHVYVCACYVCAVFPMWHSGSYTQLSEPHCH